MSYICCRFSRKPLTAGFVSVFRNEVELCLQTTHRAFTSGKFERIADRHRRRALKTPCDSHRPSLAGRGVVRDQQITCRTGGGGLCRFGAVHRSLAWQSLLLDGCLPVLVDGESTAGEGYRAVYGSLEQPAAEQADGIGGECGRTFVLSSERLLHQFDTTGSGFLVERHKTASQGHGWLACL